MKHKNWGHWIIKQITIQLLYKANDGAYWRIMKKFINKMNVLQIYSRVNMKREQNVQALTKSFATPHLCLWGSDYFDEMKAGDSSK